MYKVIIIDDEPWTIVDIEQTFALDDMGFEIIDSFRTPQKALPAIVAKKPDLVITDIRMPGMTGLELMQRSGSSISTANSSSSADTAISPTPRRRLPTESPDIA
ncbi:MAG: response regulator [[Clostridium] scindens]